MQFDRRTLLSMMGYGAGAAALSGLGLNRARAADANTITVLNWQGYGTDEAWALKIFKEKTGITVVHDYFNSEAEMVTKLRTNPGAYDVALIDTARTTQVAKLNILDPIDFSQIPNSADLQPFLKNNSNVTLDGKVYGCAWLWGMNSLAARSTVTPQPDSFQALADPKFAGRVALYDDAVNSVMLAALMTGQNPQNPSDLAGITKALKALKPNVKVLWSSEDQWDKSFAANEFDLSIYWSGSCARSRMNFHLPVDFIIPKEGAISWLDGLSVPNTSTRKAAAYKFINFMIDPGFYVEWATKVGAPASANQKAIEELPADNLIRTIHKPEYLQRMAMMGPLTNKQRNDFTNVWEEVKAYYAG
jgi:spermidine/putrescine transport system substrate-binding protein